MKKKQLKIATSSYLFKKMLRGMKITFFILLAFFMRVSATGLSQEVNVSLSCQDEMLSNVFKELEQQTHLFFFFNDQMLDTGRRVSITAENEKLATVLGRLLGKDYKWEVVNNLIVITSARTVPEEKDKPIRVVGKVTDVDKLPLPGVSITVKGLKVGTATDVNGRYSLTLPKMDHLFLMFSFIGMETQVVKYTGKDTIDVMLKEDMKTMDEVIVTGYQTFRRNEMVGSVEKVKGDDLFANGNQSLEQMLQGRIAGMSIVSTDGKVGTRQKVRVRGTSSILGNQEPVWVVDGMIQEDPLPFKPSELGSLGTFTPDNMDLIKDFVGGAIAWLNPSDIEDITVLKDASATVMYGVKAANGVIVITTKKGKAGRMSVNFDAKMSMSARVNYKDLDMMNSKDRVDVSREAISRGLIDASDLADIGYQGLYKQYLFNQISYDEFNTGVGKLETANTDWFDILFCNPVSQNYSVGFSGGSERFTYRTSLGIADTKGTAKGNDKTAYSGSVNISTWLHPTKVVFDARLSANLAKTDAFYTVDPYAYARTTNRAIPCYEEDGSLFFYDAQKGQDFKFNVLHELAHSGNTNTTSSFNGSFALRWTVLNGLKFTSTFGFGVSNVDGQSYSDEQSYYITKGYRKYQFGAYKPSDLEYQQSNLPHGGELNTTETHNMNYTWRNQLDYDGVFDGGHRLGLMFSQEIRHSKYDGYATTVYGYLPGRGKNVLLPPTMILNSGRQPTSNPIYDRFKNVVTDRESNSLAFLFNASYSYKERYVLNASVRTDASNKFGENKKSRRLPVWSLGLRWNVVEESWMSGQKLFNELSFRASYGWQGNVAENFGPDLIAKFPDQAGAIDQLTGEYLLAIKSLPYPDLRWEKTETYNFGLDMGFLKNRLMASVNYYRKYTTDLISQQSIPMEYGMVTMPVNQGNMLNQGYELTVTVTPVRTKDFVWNLSLNTAKNMNRLESKVEGNYSWQAAKEGTLLKKGYAYSSFWAFQVNGLKSDGLPDVVSPEITDAVARTDASNWMSYAGKLDADFTGGLSTVFRYKSLSLSASFNLNLGGKKFLVPLFGNTGNVPSEYENLTNELLGRWKKPGDEAFTSIPTIPYRDIKLYPLPDEKTTLSPHQIYNYSMGRVVSASFLRCNSIDLNYRLPEEMLKRISLKDVSFNFGVSNPFIIVSKDFKGKDPEVATGSQPISQTYTLGISISL